MANGERMFPLGEADVDCVFEGSVTLRKRVIVAEIEVPMILGLDIVIVHRCMLDSVAHIDGVKMQCVRAAQIPSVFRLQVAETVETPGDWQMLLKVRTSGENVFWTSVDVKGNGQFVSKNGIAWKNA